MKTLIIIVVFLCLALFDLTAFGQVNRSKNISILNSGVTNPEDPALGQSINNDAFTTSGAEYKFDYGKETGMYLNRDWSSGKIELTDGTIINDRVLRYNLYSRQMEFVVSGDTMAIANPSEIKNLTIGDRKFVFEKFVFNGEPVSDWIEVLVEGNYSLYLYRRIVYRYVESLSESNTENDRFFMTEKYYVGDNSGAIEPLPSGKRQIIKCLSEKKPGIESFIKANKLKLSDEKDLIRLMEYCNENVN